MPSNKAPHGLATVIEGDKLIHLYTAPTTRETVKVSVYDTTNKTVTFLPTAHWGTITTSRCHSSIITDLMGKNSKSWFIGYTCTRKSGQEMRFTGHFRRDGIERVYYPDIAYKLEEFTL